MKYAWMSLAAVLAGCYVATDPDSSSGMDGGVDAGVDGAIDVGVEPSIDTGSRLPDTFDPYCHYDCFRRMDCVDGVVWERIHAPVPCHAWTGSCPRVMRGACEEGCSDRPPGPATLSLPAWTLYCEEGEARRVGDPCEVDADCQPPEGTDLDRNYLGCDLASGMCAAIDPPVAPTTACTADYSSLFEPGRGSAYGVVRDATCASGLCRFFARASESECDRDVCALACSTDWDCPPMYRCEVLPDWTGRSLDEGPTGTQRVCRTVTGSDLMCR